MKTLAFALVATLLMSRAIYAETGTDLGLTKAQASLNVETGIQNVPALTLAMAPSTDISSESLISSGAAHFAQFETRSKALPVSPTTLLSVVALFILGLRILGVRQALAMAQHERHSHQGRSQSFRSLQEEQSPRH